jgi:hypothetical protein
MANGNKNSESASAFTAAVGSAPISGEVYMVNCRFGCATVYVKRVCDVWATCEVRSGTLRGIGAGAVWGAGDEKALRLGDGTRWTLI